MEIKVVEKHGFDLIKGDFFPDEAKEVLMHLFTKKINFHERRDWSHRERFGTHDEASLKRISELKCSTDEILKKIILAKDQGARLRIKSTIELEIITNK